MPAIGLPSCQSAVTFAADALRYLVATESRAVAQRRGRRLTQYERRELTKEEAEKIGDWKSNSIVLASQHCGAPP